MRVSVVIPCHNAAAWIGEALRSVAEQRFAPHEIIVVDDASTDDSVREVRAASPGGVKLLSVRHGSAAAARNAGIAAATGEWIAFLDADDVWYPEHLARAAELLAGSTDVAFQAFGDDWRHDRGVVHRANRAPVTEPTAGLADVRFLDVFGRGLRFYHSSVLVRRDVLIERGMFDPTFTRRHDIEMWLRVTKGRTWAYDPRPHVMYRVDTPGGLSRNVADRECWFLEAMLRHREAYSSPAMERLVHRAARRAMSAALTDGDAAMRRRVRALAWAQLGRAERWMFAVGGICPVAFAGINRLRRRVKAKAREERAG